MRFNQADMIALLAVPLVVAAFKANGAVLASICLTLAGAIIVLTVVRHGELPWKQRLVICSVAVAGVLGLSAYLYKVNLARALKERAAPLVAATLLPPVSSNCPIPRGAVGLYLGNSVSVVKEFPHVVFRVHGEDVFVIELRVMAWLSASRCSMTLAVLWRGWRGTFLQPPIPRPISGDRIKAT